MSASRYDKQLRSVATEIWSFRTAPAIWSDREQESEEPDNLVYKRLDGLRALLHPVFDGALSLADFGGQLPRHSIREEITSLARTQSEPGYHFYPSPHTFTPYKQPDDYVDMAAHSLSFASNCLRSLNGDLLGGDARQLLGNVVDTALTVLTAPGSYVVAKRGGTAAWGGTTTSASVPDFATIYFTSQVVDAFCDYLMYAKSIDATPAVHGTISRVEGLVKDACTWIALQAGLNSEGGTLLRTSGGVSVDEVCATNGDGLTACFRAWDYLDIGVHERVLKTTSSFLSFLVANSPGRAEWYYRVTTKEVGHQFYQDRHDGFGLVAFLGNARERLGTKWQTRDDELAERAVSFLLERPAADQLIGCLPWYVRDLCAVARLFPEMGILLTVKRQSVRKAIKRTFESPAVVQVLISEFTKHLALAAQDEVSLPDGGIESSEARRASRASGRAAKKQKHRARTK